MYQNPQSSGVTSCKEKTGLGPPCFPVASIMSCTGGSQGAGHHQGKAAGTIRMKHLRKGDFACGSVWLPVNSLY